MSCISCGNPKLASFVNFKQPRSVSSDCKPLNVYHPIVRCDSCGLIQKQLSDVYFKQIQTVYREYNPYPLTDGAEGVNFGGEVPQSRCLSILEHVQSYIPASGVWLDMGTGSGVMPRSLISKFKNNYIIWCQDLNEQHRALLEAIPEVEGFIEGSIRGIEQCFDVISLVHVLEHIVDPLTFLKEIKDKLAENGKLIIQVPDISTNALDLSIYDHIAHFSKESLAKLVGQVFPGVVFTQVQLDKEITLVASLVPSDQSCIKRPTAESYYQIHADFSVFEQTILSINKNVLVFGTGPSSIFTASLLGGFCVGWVDEDESKIGKKLLGQSIFSVDNHPSDFEVVLPFLSPQREKIVKRLININWLKIPVAEQLSIN